MSKANILRIAQRTQNFTVLDNGFINDPELSWSAKGLLAYLLSKPDQWTVRVDDLASASTNGDFAVRGVIKELERAGHLHRTRMRTPGGQWQTHTLVFERRRHAQFPTVGEPRWVNHGGKPACIVNTEGVITESSADTSAGLFGPTPIPTPNPGKKKRAKEPKAPAKKTGNPAMNPALGEWLKMWAEKHGEAYPITGRCRSALKDILSALEIKDPLAIPRVVAVFVAYLADSDPFVTKQRHPLHFLANNIHRWINAEPARGGFRSVEPTAEDEAFILEVEAETARLKAEGRAA